MAESRGVEALRQLNEGQIEVSLSPEAAKVRMHVKAELSELIEVGARIRPLLVEGQRVGWVRGVHLSERKALRRWVSDEIEFIEHLMVLGTSLPREEIRSLGLSEFRSLARVVQAMTESDLRLYPFVSAYVTTSQSEQMWYSLGTVATAFVNRPVLLPDGKMVQVSGASDQARLWAALCNYRIQAKHRLEASMNALLTIRPLVGKGADPIAADHRNIGRSLITDAAEPWIDLIRVQVHRNLDDGWAHSEDNSVAGILRELDRMMNNDRHEQVFAQLDKQELERAEKQKQQIETRVMERGGPGFYEYETSPMTPEQVRDRETGLLRGRPVPLPPTEEPQSSLMDRLAKYR